VHFDKEAIWALARYVQSFAQQLNFSAVSEKTARNFERRTLPNS